MDQISIIGDKFMESSVFKDEIQSLCKNKFKFKCFDLPWPDEPMVSNNAFAKNEKIKEFVGDPKLVSQLIKDSTILVTQLAPVTKNVIQTAKKLKFIAVARGGPVNIAISEAKAHGITVVNAPGRNSSAVAEFTVGSIIAHTRNITIGHESLRNGQFRGDLYRAEKIGNELSDTIVGIIGYGHIGQQVANLLRAFDANVLIYDPYIKNSNFNSKNGIRQVDFTQLLTESDIISLHCRATPETDGMISCDQLNLMKSSAILINTGRGSLLDYDALYSALKVNQISGAILDTFSIEPVQLKDPILKLPNVTLTPHIAGASKKTVKVAAKMIAEEIHRWLNGKPQKYLC